MQPVPTLPAVEYAERSDPGRDPEKQVNEDSCGHRETRFGHLCVVCDGMGGHAGGREASELALATIFEVFDQAAAGTPPGQVLKTSIEEASRRINVMRISEVAMGRPGSTAVAVLLHAQGTEVAHVGDSRAYLVHEGQIFRISRDHSIVQELVDRGLLTPQQATHHPDANRITRALGMATDVEAELRPEPVRHVPGDSFILCSDGLSDLVEDHEILGIVGSEPAAQAVGKLVDMANARGGHDNITVVVLRAREAAQTPAAVVAPTIAQTTALPSATQAPVTIPNSPPAGMERTDRATEPLLAPPPAAAPAPAVIPPAPEEPSPPSSHELPARHGARPAVVIAVVLAVVAVVLLAVMVISELRERGGKSQGRPGTLALPTSDAAPAAMPTTLAPGSVVVPGTGASSEPIAPLVPSPSGTGKH